MQIKNINSLLNNVIKSTAAVEMSVSFSHSSRVFDECVCDGL